MQTAKQTGMAFSSLFGSYIMDTVMNHQTENNSQCNRKHEEELFEVIDDYVEQA